MNNVGYWSDAMRCETTREEKIQGGKLDFNANWVILNV